MDAGHAAALDLELLRQYMQQQAQGGGSGRTGGHHAVIHPRVRLVDTRYHDPVYAVGGQRAQQHAARAVVEVILHAGHLAELAGGVDHHVNAEHIPGHLRRAVDLHQARTESGVYQEIPL